MLDPIVTVLQENIETEIIGETMKVSQKIGVHVDEERLRQALYDAHSFYNEGYRHGREAAAQPWISVKERLPDENALVLCVGARGGMFLGKIRRLYEEDGTAYCYVPNARSGRSATHWMPMPDVPEATV